MKIETKIIRTLNKIRPFLRRDGGDIEFIKFQDGYVHINLKGACLSCTLQDAHIKEGVEIILLEEVEGVLGLKVDNSDIANQKIDGNKFNNYFI